MPQFKVRVESSIIQGFNVEAANVGEAMEKAVKAASEGSSKGVGELFKDNSVDAYEVDAGGVVVWSEDPGNEDPPQSDFCQECNQERRGEHIASKYHLPECSLYIKP